METFNFSNWFSGAGTFVLNRTLSAAATLAIGLLIIRRRRRAAAADQAEFRVHAHAVSVGVCGLHGPAESLQGNSRRIPVREEPGRCQVLWRLVLRCDGRVLRAGHV